MGHDERDSEPGVPADLASVYDAHAGWLYRHALMILADHAAAEDAVQQVFAKLAAMGGRAGQVCDVRAYLRQAVRGECYRLLGRRRRDDWRPILEPAAPDVKDDGTREELDAALRQLPPEQREVVHLKVYEGLTFEAIGQTLEIPLNTAASRYRYAIEKLRSLLKEP
jgi:RNA polymerase sigma-70 factor, ECF subfamily